VRQSVPVALALFVLWPAGASAQPATTPVPSGLYDGFSWLELVPTGSLSGPPTAIPRWLSVSTAGRVSMVTFEPERRVTWRLVYGPHGLSEKRTDVDGVEVHRSTFEYDASGHLERKRVTGALVPSAVEVRYRTNAHGEIVERTERRTDPWTGAATTITSEVRRVGRGDRVVTTRVNGVLARRDRFDDAGRIVRTELHSRDGRAASLSYVRGRHGALLGVRRRLHGREAIADFRRPAPGIGPEDLMLLTGAWAERHEVLLLLGAPVTSSDAGRGAGRKIRDEYTSGCWLNQPSGFDSDATELVERSRTSCICGFCVDADLPGAMDDERDEVRAIDLHFTRGPWVRIDGVAVTIDHELATPGGFVAAGELRAGDVVTAADGSPHRIERVEPLPDEARRGRNVRTTSGTFTAGGLLFRSEEPRACPGTSPGTPLE
jgi:hypothetical protein